MVSDSELKDIVGRALDRADRIWGEVGDSFQKSASGRLDEDYVATSIPGHPLIDPQEPAVDHFVAFMIDIRESTKHLMQAIRAGATGLHRVLVETSALFAVVGRIVSEHGGSPVEYLGDGALALFRCDIDKAFSYAPYYAARECLAATIGVVNPAILERYALPGLEVGIGMSYSKAIVTAIGQNHRHPKVIGECVYRASRLCGGRNSIAICHHLNARWPSEKGGRLSMRRFLRGDVEGYTVVQQ